ncbi:hypothetical protein HpHA229_11530 [Helicobacter pylori]
MVVGSEEMENADNGCFMPIISSENNISDNTKYYNRIVFEFEYALKEEDKQCLIELVPIKYNNNLSYSIKEENQFKKEGLTPHNSINKP